jgi:hypothetical protein
MDIDEKRNEMKEARSLFTRPNGFRMTHGDVR